MTVSLLEHDNGRVSLEFEESDFPAVVQTIQSTHGESTRKRHATYVEYWIGDARFLFQNEWDAPCLISTSAEGDVILKSLAEKLAV